MNDLQRRKIMLDSIYEAYRFFENNHKPSGDLTSRINQFTDIFAEAEPYKMYLYQRASKES